jgi:hypothetical protein
MQVSSGSASLMINCWTLAAPCAATTPNSAMWPRIVLIN